MALPRKLKFMNLFQDGVGYKGEVTEVNLPKLAIKTEDYRAGGMLGDVAIDLGIEKLEMEVKFGGLMSEMKEFFGSPNIDGVALRYAGSYQRDDSGEVEAVEVVTRGRYTEIDGGSSKSGDDTEETYKAALTYYKLIVNGKDLIEIDLINDIYVVNGKDRLAEHRKAIGL
ncbi:phage major tail tube protein [Gallibacterium anatis]|uniref:phage major tail tube protein n=1 Tax=Gallibacterium anatis TaxID=750 RepID=UPI003004653C